MILTYVYYLYLIIYCQIIVFCRYLYTLVAVAQFLYINFRSFIHSGFSPLQMPTKHKLRLWIFGRGHSGPSKWQGEARRLCEAGICHWPGRIWEGICTKALCPQTWAPRSGREGLSVTHHSDLSLTDKRLLIQGANTSLIKLWLSERNGCCCCCMHDGDRWRNNSGGNHVYSSGISLILCLDIPYLQDWI